MKRLFILASAAIVALASCTKTQVVYTEAPEEIGFKAYAGAMTKADLNATHSSLGVFAYLEGTATQYFPNSQFTNIGNNWSGGKYWPLDAEQGLDFILYAPYASDADYATNTKVLTLTIPDNTPDADTPQVDWLYGTTVANGDKKTNSAGVTASMAHALAKVTVTLQANKADAFTFVSLTLNNTKQQGEVAVNYNATPVTAAPVEDTADGNYTHSFTGLAANAAIPAAETDMGEVLVFPSDVTSFTLKYKIGDSEELTQPIALSGTWACSKNYTYAISLNGNDIVIVPTVGSWGEETGAFAN